MCGLIRNEPGFSKTPFCIIIESALGAASRGKEMAERASIRLETMVHLPERGARRVIIIPASLNRCQKSPSVCSEYLKYFKVLIAGLQTKPC